MRRWCRRHGRERERSKKYRVLFSTLSKILVTGLSRGNHGRKQKIFESNNQNTEEDKKEQEEVLFKVHCFSSLSLKIIARRTRAGIPKDRGESAREQKQALASRIRNKTMTMAQQIPYECLLHSCNIQQRKRRQICKCPEAHDDMEWNVHVFGVARQYRARQYRRLRLHKLAINMECFLSPLTRHSFEVTKSDFMIARI